MLPCREMKTGIQGHFDIMALERKKYGILYVDDEKQSLSYFSKAFDGIVPIYTAGNASEGLAVFQEHQQDIGVVLSDKRMPGMSGIEFLENVRALDDAPLRILVTAYTDLDLAVEALNDGLLYSYLTKPWVPADMKKRLLRALDRFWISKEKNRLLRGRVTAVNDLIKTEKALNAGNPSPDLNHFLRDSLSIVQAFLDMIPLQLKDELKGSPPEDPFFWNDYYKAVEDQLSRVAAVLIGISEDGSIGGTLNLQDGVDIAELFESTANSLLANCSEINFTIAKDGEPGPVRGDHQKLQQMASRIIEQSIKNTKQKGDIEVKISTTITTTNQNRKSAVKVMCIDNGLPLTDDNNSSMFGAFSISSGNTDDLKADMFLAFLTVFQHGGTIKADRLSDSRNVIELVLPVQSDTPANQAIPYN